MFQGNIVNPLMLGARFLVQEQDNEHDFGFKQSQKTEKNTSISGEHLLFT
jgi:hypothetical protein